MNSIKITNLCRSKLMNATSFHLNTFEAIMRIKSCFCSLGSSSVLIEILIIIHTLLQLKKVLFVSGLHYIFHESMSTDETTVGVQGFVDFVIEHQLIDEFLELGAFIRLVILDARHDSFGNNRQLLDAQEQTEEAILSLRIEEFFIIHIANKYGQLHHYLIVPSHEHGDIIVLLLQQPLFDVVPALQLKDWSLGKQEAVDQNTQHWMSVEDPNIWYFQSYFESLNFGS